MMNSVELRHHQPPSSAHTYVQHSHTTSTSSTATSSSRASPNPVHPQSTTQSQPPHIRFRGASNSRTQKNEASSSDTSPAPTPSSQGHQKDIPPPSPRLQPTLPSTLSLNNSLANSPSRIKVRDLSHIQSFASEEILTRSRQPSRQSLKGKLEGGQQYEISAMPVTDIIEMVAGLLTKITTTNDRQHQHLQRHVPSDGSANLTSQASSVLAFHGKNVPTITIASYLMRIHKYCPTTYEVFLSLLIYFDRMTMEINNGSLKNFPPQENRRPPSERSESTDSSVTVKPDCDMMDSPSTMRSESPQKADRSRSMSESTMQNDSPMHDYSSFVVDSFNIHRLIMAGVTCASKFFSDVFYTNSRYAKVGGLPLVELNHLELQFLLLNDFHLSIPLEELDAYGTMLVEFYAGEIVSQQQHAQAAMQPPMSPRSPQDSDGIYMKMPTSP